MNKSQLVISLRSKVFGDRGTDVMAAFDYAETIINGLSESSDRGPAWTAVHVLANTIANAIEALPAELVGQLPAPPAEVNIKGMPMTLSLDRATLDQIIDERIQNWYEHDFDMDHEVSRVIDDYDFSDTVRDIVKNNISFSIDVD
jgi:hypothetical protein